MAVAKEVMTKDVMSIKPSTSVIEAIDLLLENKISGLPVVDDDNNLIGIISEKDLLHILFRENMNVKETIDKHMSKKVSAFDEDDKVTDICEFFLDSSFSRAPIVTNGKLVGIISRRDILKCILVAVVNAQK